jgi:hypothetical protein
VPYKRLASVGVLPISSTGLTSKPGTLKPELLLCEFSAEEKQKSSEFANKHLYEDNPEHLSFHCMQPNALPVMRNTIQKTHAACYFKV